MLRGSLGNNPNEKDTTVLSCFEAGRTPWVGTPCRRTLRRKEYESVFCPVGVFPVPPLSRFCCVERSGAGRGSRVTRSVLRDWRFCAGGRALFGGKRSEVKHVGLARTAPYRQRERGSVGVVGFAAPGRGLVPCPLRGVGRDPMLSARDAVEEVLRRRVLMMPVGNRS